MKSYQLHKIPGISKETCTAEQMMAYNYAHTYADLNITGAGLALMVLRWRKGNKTYNNNAIAHLLSMHFDKYKATRQICTSYEAVAKAFPVKID